ncbi:hypothetical protein PSCFBP3800_05482 [Pseudomonas syringae group genomosp. 3]|uniref:DNA-binding protein n=2 Tax=Pseudomonas syringae group TaxID=136849 RepID=A0A3M2X355_PSEA0|nr:DNA-binding protein [Pseudomonas amygdali pv. morsprunorum]SOS36766.1 hypothetical protein CFBP6411_05409 [Pseudomonas syringae group genomosp. 3]SPF20932.1 hypothetical protein PSCFBP3800_05482 [Pseudomonas syringae group genomosp. 3]
MAPLPSGLGVNIRASLKKKSPDAWASCQPAYAQQENVTKPRKATREKIALAFEIKADQLES